MGVGASPSLFAYYPKTLSVKAGTTVTFVNKSPSEVHNIVFGPKKYLQQWGKTTDLMPQGPGSPNQVTPILPYGTDPEAAQRTTERRRTGTASSRRHSRPGRRSDCRAPRR